MDLHVLVTLNKVPYAASNTDELIHRLYQLFDIFNYLSIQN